MAYYNTTNESNVTEYLKISQKQDDIVLRTIEQFKTFTCSEIYKKYPIMNTPITSIRRSVNTLKKKGVIVETGNKRKGLYGRNELEYKLA
jgi:hypothetical protein